VGISHAVKYMKQGDFSNRGEKKQTRQLRRIETATNHIIENPAIKRGAGGEPKESIKKPSKVSKIENISTQSPSA